MPQAMTADLTTRIANECATLPPGRQSEVLDFVLFIKQRPNVEPVDEDEEKWGRLFNDPAKMENFMRWGQKALAEPGDEPLITSGQ